MDDSVLAIYCLCADILKALNHYEDPQRRMTDAEVMTTAIVAALYFGGNFERARLLFDSPRYIPSMLSRSQFNRRLHALRELLLLQKPVYLVGQSRAVETKSLHFAQEWIGPVEWTR